MAIVDDIILQLNGQVVSIRRFAPTTYIAGVATIGAETSIPAIASIQPVVGRELEALPEGRRTTGVMKAYIAVTVETVDEITLTEADEMVWNGRRFELHAVEPWVGNLTHWKSYLFEKNTQEV